uniref:Uncharacterized protein n=1 Tax=Arundo donax TaxID=35708 RepID=A0A0A9EQP4_ARUDO
MNLIKGEQSDPGGSLGTAATVCSILDMECDGSWTSSSGCTLCVYFLTIESVVGCARCCTPPRVVMCQFNMF